MKMKLELEIDTPDEKAELLIALQAQEIMLSINDLYNNVRSFLKHGDETQAMDKLEEVYQELAYLNKY